MNSVAMALRFYDLAVRFLEARRIRISDLEERRAKNNGSLSLKDMDELEQSAYQSVEDIPE